MECSKFCPGKQNASSPKVAKNITVYLNGFRTEKYKVTLDPNKLGKWYHFLNEITNKIHPYFGAVKKLYSSDSGVTVCSFSDLDNYGIYVASDNRKFKLLKGGYTDYEDKKNYFEHYLSGHLRRNNKRRKLTHIRNDLIVIYVFTNGKDREPPKKFVLSKEDLKNWDQTLSFIGLTLDVPCRAIKSLYNSNGNQICGPWELQHGATYIAVSYDEKFIPRNYRINESTTEYWKNGEPPVHRDKNIKCTHRIMENSWLQDLKWKRSADNLCKCVQKPKSNPKSSQSWNPNHFSVSSTSRYSQKCTCSAGQAESSSSSSNANSAALFTMPSDKYSFLQNSSSHRSNPLYSRYERRYHPNQCCAYDI